MPSDKHNSITAKAMDLICLLFDVALCLLAYHSMSSARIMDLPSFDAVCTGSPVIIMLQKS